MKASDPKSMTAAAQGWARRLADCPLPVLPATPPAMRELLSGSRSSMQDLGIVVGRDPAATWQVLRTANTLSAQRGMPIRDLTHALSLLGIERLREMVGRFDNEQPVDDAANGPYRRLLMVSLHAGTLARRLFEHSHSAQAIEQGWVAMLWLAPAWALARVAPEVLPALAAKGAEETLGCRWEQLAALLFRHWKLQRLLDAPLQDRSLIGSRQWAMLARAKRERRGSPLSWDEALRDVIGNDGTYIELANRIAISAQQDWYSRSMARWLRVCGNLLGMAPAQAAALLHQQAAVVSRLGLGAAAQTPAARLLLPPDADSFRFVASRRSRRATVGTGRRADARCLQQQSAKLADRSLQSAPQILQCLLRALHQGLGLERVAIATYSRTRQEIAVQAVAGITADSPLKGYRQQVESGDLFGRLLAGNKGVWCNDSNRERLAAIVPARFRLATQGRQFLAAPLRGGERPLAIVYADAGSQGPAFSEREYRLFCELCRRAGAALQRLQAGAG